jgi:hypothetical protein
VAITFSLVALVLFIFQTTLFSGAYFFKNVDLFIILTAYLGFTHTAPQVIIPVVFMGLLAHTFSGGYGATFVIMYGLIFLLCFAMRRKANLDLLIYRMTLIFVCSLWAGVLFLGYRFFSKVWLPFQWSTLLVPAITTTAISPVMCRMFHTVDGWRQHLPGSFRSGVTLQKPERQPRPSR